MSYGKEIFRNKYKETMDSLNTIKDNYYELDKEYQLEIERLNNIINELENFMKMQQELYRSVLSKRPENDSEYNTQYATMVGNEQLSIILEKLQELKGSDKE